MDPFIGVCESEKRGGAGTMSVMGGWDSGNRVSGELMNVRTNSEGEIGDGCRDLW